MARKKKEQKEITPSKYQADIFDFIQHGQGNLVVEASAGSGKTWTLTKCLDFIDTDKRVLLTAFNSDIVTVLSKKAKDHPNVTTSTLHSLGRTMLMRNFPNNDFELAELKYKSYISTNIKTLSSINTYALSKSDFARYMHNIEQYVDFGRAYLCQTVKDLDFIEERYDIDTIADEKEIALDVMEYGKNTLDIIDFTDMIWLPNVLMCRPIGLLFDWIFIDEAQDLSVCQREIIFKCTKINTRLVMLGDGNQALYSFSSSDSESFRKLKKLPNTISLPLSVSYRCAKNIVNFAKEIVPSIEYCGDGREGEIKYDVTLDEIQDGDMVLCRNNAPLMQLYIEFIGQNKKCFIRGKDIGANMKNVVKKTGINELNVDLSKDGVFARLYSSLFDVINELVGKYNISYNDAIETTVVSNRLDMIRALEILSKDINTVTELNAKISSIFSNRKSGGISLSTIHKAKGLEANNVYIACRELMPSKQAKKDWEMTQEYNLMYVAYTRAKDKLGFIASSEVDGFSGKATDSAKALKEIEARVNYVLNKKPKEIDASNPFIAKDIIRHATVLEKPVHNTKIMNMSNMISERKNNTLSNIFRQRMSQKRKIR